MRSRTRTGHVPTFPHGVPQQALYRQLADSLQDRWIETRMNASGRVGGGTKRTLQDLTKTAPAYGHISRESTGEVTLHHMWYTHTVYTPVKYVVASLTLIQLCGLPRHHVSKVLYRNHRQVCSSTHVLRAFVRKRGREREKGEREGRGERLREERGSEEEGPQGGRY